MKGLLHIRRETTSQWCFGVRWLTRCGPHFSCWKRPSHTLFAPERLNLAVNDRVDIIERDHFILRYISTQYTTFREANWQSRQGARGSSVVDEPVGAEPANAIEPLAVFRSRLATVDDLADRAVDRSDGRITMNDRSADGRSDLDVRQMKRRVEDVEWAFAKFVVCELGSL